MGSTQVAGAAEERSAYVINTVVGTGVAGSDGDGGPAGSAELQVPGGIAVDSTGALYIADTENHRVRKVTPDGIITTVAGTGNMSAVGDNGPAVSAQLKSPSAVAVDSTGVLYIADTENHRVRKVTPDGIITTVAGTGNMSAVGDNGPAASALLNSPRAVAVDSAGVLYIAEHDGHRVRKVAVDGTITTLAGTGEAGFAGDGGPAVSAQLNTPRALALDSAGNVYIADYKNDRVRKVTADGTITTVAGRGDQGTWGDGPAPTVLVLAPVGLAVDSAGVLYIAENGRRVRQVTTDGMISTFAGSWRDRGFDGDGGPPAAALLSNPFGLAVDGDDSVYIADRGNNRVRKVASAKPEGLPESGTVVFWANVRSRLRMAVLSQSKKDGAQVHHLPASPRDYQRWRLVVVGQDGGDVLYRIENVRSGKVLEVDGVREASGASVAQRAYEGAEAHHQQWKLVPVGAAADTPRAYEIVNRNSGLRLRAESNAPGAIRQRGPEGEAQARQWHLLPV
ncbi:RICIN domain-containing protein [Streptomyces sp. NPDC029674]|uniref:NHL domain-containing protein n=1 Tax=Streptomyces sp. NPDC029674 TaxID=3365297 RepID=UPI003850EA54